MSGRRPRLALVVAAEVDPLLTRGEIAAACRVDPTTVTRWAIEGRLPCLWTVGGHRRYRQSAVAALLGGAPGVAGPSEAG